MKIVKRNSKKFIITNALYESIKKKKSFLTEVNEDYTSHPGDTSEFSVSPEKQQDDMNQDRIDNYKSNEELFDAIDKQIEKYIKNINNLSKNENFLYNKKYSLFSSVINKIILPSDIIDSIRTQIFLAMKSLSDKNIMYKELDEYKKAGFEAPEQIAIDIVKYAMLNVFGVNSKEYKSGNRYTGDASISDVTQTFFNMYIDMIIFGKSPDKLTEETDIRNMNKNDESYDKEKIKEIIKKYIDGRIKLIVSDVQDENSADKLIDLINFIFSKDNFNKILLNTYTPNSIKIKENINKLISSTRLKIKDKIRELFNLDKDNDDDEKRCSEIEKYIEDVFTSNYKPIKSKDMENNFNNAMEELLKVSDENANKDEIYNLLITKYNISNSKFQSVKYQNKLRLAINNYINNMSNLKKISDDISDLNEIKKKYTNISEKLSGLYDINYENYVLNDLVKIFDEMFKILISKDYLSSTDKNIYKENVDNLLNRCSTVLKNEEDFDKEDWGKTHDIIKTNNVSDIQKYFKEKYESNDVSYIEDKIKSENENLKSNIYKKTK